MSRHSTCRGTYYKPHIYAFITKASKSLHISFNAYVNRVLDKVVSGQEVDAIGEEIKLEAQRDALLREEASLRHRLTVILRSGAYLQDYAEKLLLGGPEEVNRIRNRIGIYAKVEEKELDVILRILARREAVVQELIALEDQLLPKEKYPLALTEKGWRIGRSSSRVRTKKQQEGGEKARCR